MTDTASQVGASCAFWDETTQSLLGWPEVWSAFQPISKAGARYKRGVRPFLPHEMMEWQAAMHDWQAMLGAIGDVEWRKGVTDALRELPDCLALLHLIEQGAGLRQVDFFEIKTFLRKGHLLESMLLDQGLSFPWWVSVEWEALLDKLNPSGEIVPAFSLADVGDSVLGALREDLAQVEAAMFACRKEQTERLRARYGRGPSKEGQYVWEKAERVRLTEAAQDAEIRLVQENVFEAVYQVVEPAVLDELRAQRERTLVEIEDREMIVLQHLVREFQPHVEALVGAFHALARLDWTLVKASVAFQWHGGVVGAVCTSEEKLEGVAGDAVRGVAVSVPAGEPWLVCGGWHPVVRDAVEKRGGTFTWLDMDLQRGVGLITGPNMGGKTIVLKTFGLLQALAQHAMPVPAEQFHFQLVDLIGLSGGDEQNMVSGLSSFGGEMQRIAHLLKQKGTALLLLDEVARTTNPEEGEALAIGLASFLVDSSHTAVMASHFTGVTQVAGIQGFRVAGLRTDVLAELEQSGTTGDVLQRLQSAMDYRLVKS
ncbi:MAG: MutS-related protein, partial [Tumebacillaceae bacterium]